MGDRGKKGGMILPCCDESRRIHPEPRRQQTHTLKRSLVEYYAVIATMSTKTKTATTAVLI